MGKKVHFRKSLFAECECDIDIVLYSFRYIILKDRNNTYGHVFVRGL